MSRLVRNIVVIPLLCIAVIVAAISGAAYAMATVPGTYLPLVTQPPAPINVLHVPVDFLLDSPIVATDGSGTTFVAVQAVVGEEHAKVAVVYKILADGSLAEVQREPDIY